MSWGCSPMGAHRVRSAAAGQARWQNASRTTLKVTVTKNGVGCARENGMGCDGRSGMGSEEVED